MGVGRIGPMAGPIVGGALMTYGFDNRALFAVAATPALLGALCSLLLGRASGTVRPGHSLAGNLRRRCQTKLSRR